VTSCLSAVREPVCWAPVLPPTDVMLPPWSRLPCRSCRSALHTRPRNMAPCCLLVASTACPNNQPVTITTVVAQNHAQLSAARLPLCHVAHTPVGMSIVDRQSVVVTLALPCPALPWRLDLAAAG
jgi:hypothetical protein